MIIDENKMNFYFSGIPFIFSYLVLFCFNPIDCDNIENINLHEDHLPYYFNQFPSVSAVCEKTHNCPFKKHITKNKCWGYESDCTRTNQYSIPRCPGDHRGWVKSKFDQQDTFYHQADFGYIKEQLEKMKLYCEPFFIDDSSLECSENLRFCRGRNLMINFTSLLERDEPIRYKMDVLSDGDIGGYCEFKKELLDKQLDHLSPLQSWAPEFRYFTRLKRKPIIEGDCDVILEKPTYILKIDATVNMYHHFCDFLNLYASLHINASHPSAFSTDVHVLIWETYTYRSSFQDTWKAFTDHPILDLKDFKGKKVCFKNVVFPLLPRMIFGLYYNTPIIYGCEGSGLFDAFSKHILHRLKIPFYKRYNKKIRITFLSRETRYRRILNEDEIVTSLNKNKHYEVQKISFNQHIPFKKQLEITRNTDIFIGIHGAGLTHLLFLPQWAAVFEVYNCEDPNCYLDLARLAGVKYFTWANASLLQTVNDGSYEGGAHAKFVNYHFDPTEFLKIVEKAAKHVKNHPSFMKLFDDTNHAHNEL
ncbi:EGF domain-specific O-linked N-acetylglucosamine transferase isoform X2 [Harmonia axyridis]|uniref:EGF domain-specific O-linked N-acetylglucosamine transferase isoform X2 n=1 Tax=Harmonia axyridis TaxID=115357 RepID=UPI001E27639A|nr:EGF domain-specific O-linked N-acetylglucosamine transferase isoform X2 [Harmonia axyridis]